MKPVVHGLEAEYWGRVDFLYFDRDDPDNSSVMDQYNFRVQPQFVLIDAQGNVLNEWVGYISEDDLRPALDAAIADG